MNHTVLTSGRVPVFLWNKGVIIEPAAIKQFEDAAQLPFAHHHVAGMPDAHWGVGCPVGSVFASLGAVVPALVGVDIGCGMAAAKLNLTRKQFQESSLFSSVRPEIERVVPMGRTNNGGKGDRGAWANIPDDIFIRYRDELSSGYGAVVTKHPELNRGNTANHLGTLGTGNHFIEIQYDETGQIWIMLHSGSRGPGNRIGTYFIQKAKDLMEKFFITPANKDLAYFPKDTELYDDYNSALYWAQNFAKINREIMLGRVLGAMQKFYPGTEIVEEINTHHNYAEFENHFGKNVLLTRKGAIRAREGDMGIIPGSMGTASYIVRGLGNPLSFHSCSHGAGRAMSRTEAKKRFTIADHEAAVAGIDCRRDADVIDETPAAYKDISAVIAAQSDLITPVHELHQLLCCKG